MGRPEGSTNKEPTKLQMYEILVEASVDLYGLGKIDTIKKAKLMEVAICHGINVYEKAHRNAKQSASATIPVNTHKGQSSSKGLAAIINMEDELGLEDFPDNMDAPLNQVTKTASPKTLESFLDVDGELFYMDDWICYAKYRNEEVLASLIADIDEDIPPKNEHSPARGILVPPPESVPAPALVPAPARAIPANREVMNNRTQWYQDIGNLGYKQADIRAPNRAVQAIMGCILSDEMHKYFVSKELALNREVKSPILFLGVNGMINLVNKFKDTGYDIVSCKNFIDQKYSGMAEIIFKATEREVKNLKVFMDCLTVLEKANGIKLTFPPLKNRNTGRYRQVAATPEAFNTCLFDMNMLTEEERAEFGMEINEAEESDPRLTDLNLFNCAGFPILAPREVELLIEQFHQDIWKSKNLGVLAPINLDTWISLAGIQKDEIKSAISDAQNFIRRIDKMDMVLPFTKDLLGWKYPRGDGFFLGQKGHQARMEEKRNDFYLKKMWRTFCPYFKCNCSNYGRDKGSSCPDGILWFDHVIWCVMNNLDKVWPNKPAKVRFAFFTRLLQGPLRKAVIAYIAYLKVRETLIGMTIRYKDYPTADLNAEFGNNKMTELMEKTVRPRNFLVGCNQNTPLRAYDGKRKSNEHNEGNSDFVLPPKIYKMPSPVINATKELLIVEDTPENSPEPCHGNRANGIGRASNAGTVQTKLPF